MTDPMLDLDMDDIPLVPGTTPGAPIQALRAMHDRAVEALAIYTNAEPSVIRVRDASTAAWHDPERRHQVTVRFRTAGGAVAKEWEDILEGRTRRIVYGWLDGEEVKQVIILDAQALLEDTLDRPGCLVPPPNARATNRAALTHHAPGGAEFLVIDVRRLPKRTVLGGVGPVEWSTRPADVAYQPDLFAPTEMEPPR